MESLSSSGVCSNGTSASVSDETKKVNELRHNEKQVIYMERTLECIFDLSASFLSVKCIRCK